MTEGRWSAPWGMPVATGADAGTEGVRGGEHDANGNAWAPAPFRPLPPAVIEADADAVVACLVQRHLVAEPALPQEHGSGPRRDRDELAVLRSRLRFLRGRCHHEAQARV